MTRVARPILFSGSMVRALLAGQKTQTRRVMASQPFANGFHFDGHDLLCHNDYLPPSATLMTVGHGRNQYTTSDLESDGFRQHCPYGFAGDLLWVRETWSGQRDRPIHSGEPFYRADGERSGRQKALSYIEREARWRPSIHMPRHFSRLTLLIKDVRTQRLHEISEEDAQAEGITDSFPEIECNSARPFAEGYRWLWEQINGAASWDANPWVWALSFCVEQRNVDDVLQTAA